MDYKLNLGAWGSVFAVPSAVAERLAIASGDHVKVLLYILKNADLACSAESVAKACGVSVSEVDDAIVFWQNAEILEIKDGELSPAQTAVSREAPAARPLAPPAIPTAPDRSAEITAALHAQTQFPPKEIASAVNNSEAVKYLFETYERLAGRPTKHAERNALMLMIEDIGLRCEVAIMLVEYCFSIEKATPAYMRSVAEDWWKSGVDSLVKAEERIKEIKRSHELEARLRRKFELSSAFSSSQKKDIADWAGFGMEDGLFDKAYDITVRNTGRFSFAYMNKIIRGWNADGIHELSQIEKKAAEKGGAVGNKKGDSSFDLGDIAEWSHRKYSNLHKKGDDSE